jgi:hypothetical protein
MTCESELAAVGVLILGVLMLVLVVGVIARNWVKVLLRQLHE